MGCASSKESSTSVVDDARASASRDDGLRRQDDDVFTVNEIRDATTMIPTIPMERMGEDDDDASREDETRASRLVTRMREELAIERERRARLEIALAQREEADDANAEATTEDVASKRLRAMEGLVSALGMKARRTEILEAENARLVEEMDALKRDAKAFCSECEVEAELAIEQARNAVMEARRTMKEQSVRYEGALEDSERMVRHKIATATLKAKSETARAKLRANEALEQSETFRAEIVKLQRDLDEARDRAAVSSVRGENPRRIQTDVSQRDATLYLNSEFLLPGSQASNALVAVRDDDVSTVSDFGRDDEFISQRWQLWAMALLRRHDKRLVRDAEGSLELLAQQQIMLEELKREKRNAADALREMNTMLIESRDEVYDLKRGYKA